MSVNGENNPFFGKKHSIESRKKMSKKAKLRHGQDSTNWKGGISTPGICVDCKKNITNYRAKRCQSCAGKNKFIHYPNPMKGVTGNSHPGWKGGIAFNPYPLGWTKTYKEQIRYRDGYKCQVCSMPEVENGRKLSIHHKDYDKNNINVDNLVSLCSSCHTKTNHNRDYWQRYFKNKQLETIHGQQVI